MYKFTTTKNKLNISEKIKQINPMNGIVLSVNEACDLIDAFLQLEEVKTHRLSLELKCIRERFAELEALLSSLKNKDEDEINRKPELSKKSNTLASLSTSLCNDLRAWMNIDCFKSVIKNTLSFNKVIFAATITLAELNPINTEDPISLESFVDIPSDDVVCLSDRYRFEKTTLSNWLPIKLINPATRVALDKLDEERLCNMGVIRTQSSQDDTKEPGVDDEEDQRLLLINFDDFREQRRAALRERDYHEQYMNEAMALCNPPGRNTLNTRVLARGWRRPQGDNSRFSEYERDMLQLLITGRCPDRRDEIRRCHHNLVPNDFNYLDESVRLRAYYAVREINRLNIHQTKALLFLYKSGLRGDHLGLWEPGHGEGFSMVHVNTLLALMLIEGESPERAVRSLTLLSEWAASRRFNEIMNSQNSPQESIHRLPFSRATIQHFSLDYDFCPPPEPVIRSNSQVFFQRLERGADETDTSHVQYRHHRHCNIL